MPPVGWKGGLITLAGIVAIIGIIFVSRSDTTGAKVVLLVLFGPIALLAFVYTIPGALALLRYFVDRPQK